MVRVKGRYALTDHWFEEFENEDDTECEQLDFIRQGDVENLWSKIEQYRRAIAWQEARFNRWLQVSPQLAKHWKQFIDAGGITAEDFSKFCAGTMRHRSTREKQHLRLVSTNNRPKHRVRLRSSSQDDDVA